MDSRHLVFVELLALPLQLLEDGRCLKIINLQITATYFFQILLGLGLLRVASVFDLLNEMLVNGVLAVRA